MLHASPLDGSLTLLKFRIPLNSRIVAVTAFAVAQSDSFAKKGLINEP
jgi:hypothetical protein